MALHILKLCVGCDSIADLEGWIEETRLLHKRLGRPYRQFHTTRMIPKRMDEISGKGSLYWVIKGYVAARQPILSIEPITDTDGISRCQIVLEPVVTPVRSRPYRSFQGWRYLLDKDAPPDLAGGGALTDMPEAMQRELRSLGLL
ncbi:COG5458 Uncharacterized conserved protein [Rhabdaerophilaceae bacterium]